MRDDEAAKDRAATHAIAERGQLQQDGVAQRIARAEMGADAYAREQDAILYQRIAQELYFSQGRAEEGRAFLKDMLGRPSPTEGRLHRH